MRKAKRFILREKQVFLAGFSLTFPRFLRISKNRLNTSLTKATLGPFSQKRIFGKKPAFLRLKMRVSFNLLLSKINYINYHKVVAAIITELESCDMITGA